MENMLRAASGVVSRLCLLDPALLCPLMRICPSLLFFPPFFPSAPNEDGIRPEDDC